MRIAIVTIYDNNNFGNRLQNYAVQQSLKKMNTNSVSIKYERDYETEIKYKIKDFLRHIKWLVLKHNRYNKLKRFHKFNQNIDLSRKFYNCKNIKEVENKFEQFIVGSDQVWNPNFDRLTDIELLNFTNKPKIAFSASFGISELPKKYCQETKVALSKFKAISVREEAGKDIIDKFEINKDIEVLVDPTMLLSSEEWDEVSKKTKNFKEGEKYILNYFLGTLPEEWNTEIKRVAMENNCKIINILDENDPYFAAGPSEFLFLEKNAFLVCTDSFHSSVFSIIYDTPFVVFERKDNFKSMNSRLDTLLSKFELENRKFKGNITEDLLKCNYDNAKKILEKEKEKSLNFLRNALDINE